MAKLNVFGSVDRDYKDNVTSEYPAWYFETHLENMKEVVKIFHPVS